MAVWVLFIPFQSKPYLSCSIILQSTRIHSFLVLILISSISIESIYAVSHFDLGIIFCRIVENDLFKQDWRSRKKVQIFQYIFLKWTLVLLIGLSTGLVGFFNNIGVENIAGFKLLLTSNLMLEEK